MLTKLFPSQCGGGDEGEDEVRGVGCGYANLVFDRGEVLGGVEKRTQKGPLG